MIATRPSNVPVKAGDKLAGTRIIPLVIEQEKMENARRAAGEKPLMRVLPWKIKKAGLITTGSEVAKGRITDKFSPVVKAKLAEYGCEVCWHETLSDDAEPITQAIQRMLAAGAELICCTGGMSVDPDDRTPLAIKNSGVEIISYGAPVLPGAMFLLSYTKDTGIPVLGLPGCVMYAKRTIFDLALCRIMAGKRISAQDLAALGNGGLCLNCPTCTYPNCGFGKSSL
jgi:molybdenum cofactor synthesis domain-containing protein